MPLARTDIEASLAKIEQMLGVRGGPFFMGSGFTMVDCIYAPFLERWRFQAGTSARLLATAEMLALCSTNLACNTDTRNLPARA